MPPDAESSSLEGLSSRLFVKGIPHNATEADLRKHFSAGERTITDLKILPKRGIGFVGFKTPEEATKAAKYFNRTFLRLSKLSVELAKPVGDSRRKNDQPQRRDTRDAVSAETKSNKRKLGVTDDETAKNPRLKEFLDVMQHSRSHDETQQVETGDQPIPEHESDDEYDTIAVSSRTSKRLKLSEEPVMEEKPQNEPLAVQPLEALVSQPDVVLPTSVGIDASDDEWLRSRTNRLLDLVDADEVQPLISDTQQSHVGVINSADERQDPSPEKTIPTGGNAPAEVTTEEAVSAETAISKIRQTSRLYVRNLPYTATQNDLWELFLPFGDLEQVHLPTDREGKSKGFAFVQYLLPSHAVEAFQKLDASIFQGRNIHILPGDSPKDEGLDEFAISKLPLKQQNQIRQKQEAAKKSFSWNSMWMSQDAVTATMAKKLGVSKAEVLDPTSSDAAVKQAIAETTTIQENKAYFIANGVDLDAFKSRKRGDAVILVKNFPHGTTTDELRSMFEEHGTVVRVLMPPSGTIAIIQFAHATQGKIAFQALAFRRFKNSFLFLEKAPEDIFSRAAGPSDSHTAPETKSAVHKVSVADLLEEEEAEEAPTTSLFVKNLNFDTRTAGLAKAFESLEGFVSAVVKTRPDPKKSGNILSMGFGFVEFKTKAAAQAAIKMMDGFTLDGHALSVKATHKGHDAAEERRREDKARKAAGQHTKIVIKNLPFEATKKDVYELFGTYGKLRSVRVPKKFGSTATRGFAFAEFVTPREAENALNALRDTHLLGRRLVLGYAEAEAVDAEEEIAKMQRKVGKQVSKVRLQQLTGGRKKIEIGENNEDELGG